MMWGAVVTRRGPGDGGDDRWGRIRRLVTKLVFLSPSDISWKRKRKQQNFLKKKVEAEAKQCKRFGSGSGSNFGKKFANGSGSGSEFFFFKFGSGSGSDFFLKKILEAEANFF